MSLQLWPTSVAFHRRVGHNPRVSRFGVNPRKISLSFVKLPNVVPARSCQRVELRFTMQHIEANEAWNIGDRDGVIIVDHGSRLQQSNLMLNDLVTMFKSKTGYPIVEAAHMELAKPSISDAFDSCVQQGANRVIISPFFLFPGRHWQEDIPSLAREAALKHPGVSFIVAAPLGLHELIVDIIHDRIKYCLRHAAGLEDECSVCAGTGKCQLMSIAASSQSAT